MGCDGPQGRSRLSIAFLLNQPQYEEELGSHEGFLSSPDSSCTSSPESSVPSSPISPSPYSAFTAPHHLHKPLLVASHLFPQKKIVKRKVEERTIVNNIVALKERARDIVKESQCHPDVCRYDPTGKMEHTCADVLKFQRDREQVQLLLSDSSPFDPHLQHSKSGGGGGKRLKRRERASIEQVAFLERIFALEMLPSAETRAKLAQRLGMSPKRVQIWFQNKRARLKSDQKVTDKHTTTPREEGFTFHNLALCEDGQLVLRSEGAPPLVLQPTLHREKY